jgi:hypothetical protein
MARLRLLALAAERGPRGERLRGELAVLGLVVRVRGDDDGLEVGALEDLGVAAAVRLGEPAAVQDALFLLQNDKDRP